MFLQAMRHEKLTTILIGVRPQMRIRVRTSIRIRITKIVQILKLQQLHPIGEAKTLHHTSHPSSVRRSLGACSAHVCECAKAHHQAGHCHYYKTQQHTAHPAAYGIHWVPAVHRRVMSRRTHHKHDTAPLSLYNRHTITFH